MTKETLLQFYNDYTANAQEVVRIFEDQFGTDKVDSTLIPFEDFYERIGNKMNEKKLEHLICSEVFHKFGDVDIILSIYNSLKNKTNTNQLDFFDDIDNIAVI